MNSQLLPLVVVKIGGSLFDHQALGPGLRRWLGEQSPGKHLFVPGGGELAEVIRKYHRVHSADENACHWMAIESMAINARLCRNMLPDCHDVHHPLYRHQFSHGVLNAYHFCLHDEANPGTLPHDWRVTSDAIAARAAEVGKAIGLVLLKSTDCPDGIDWPEASRRGLVDAMYPEIVDRSKLHVQWINFRRYLDGIC